MVLQDIQPIELFKPFIFLSYAKEDKEKVLRIYNKLKAINLRPWLDEHDLLPGYDWDSIIKETIKQSKFFLVFISNNSVNKRGYIQKEIKIALDIAEEIPEDNIFIIPIRLERCKVPDRLSKWQWWDIFKKGAFEKLKTTLILNLGDQYTPPIKKLSSTYKVTLPEMSPLNALLFDTLKNSEHFKWCKYDKRKYALTNGHFLEIVNKKPNFIKFLESKSVFVSRLERVHFDKIIPTKEVYKKDSNELHVITFYKSYGYALWAKNRKHRCVVSPKYWALLSIRFLRFKAYIYSENHLKPVIFEQDDEFVGLIMPLRILIEQVKEF